MAVSEESAVLEVEIDDGDAFAKLDEHAKKSAQTTAQQFERAVKKVTRFWEEFFDFLKQGSAETKARIEKIEGAFKGVKSQVAEMTAQSGPVNALLTTIEDILGTSNQLPGAFRALGETIGALVTGPLGGMLMMIREARNLAAGGQLGGAGVADEIIRRTNALVAAGNARAIGGANLANASTAAVGLGAGQAAAAETTRLARMARRGGGGGGGGGGARASSDPLFARVQREAAVAAQIRALQEQEANAAVAARAQAADAWQAQNESRIAQEQATANSIIEIQQQLSDAQSALADAEIARAEMVGNAWRAQMDVLKGMAQASLQAGMATLLQTGNAAKAARAVLAALSMQAGTKALFELAEGVAALATTWGAPNPAATGHFTAAAMFGGIAGGASLLGKAAFGGNFGRQSNGARGGAGGLGGGGGFASPRSGGGGGGPQKIEQTIIIKASGDILDSDRALRRMARHIRELGERGYDS